MARKLGIPSQGQGDHHLGLELQYGSDDDYYGDSDPGDFSESDGFESDVTLEEINGGKLGFATSQAAASLPRANKKGASASSGDALALVPAEEAANNPYDVDSDEEKAILKGIKDEITDMVRGEMKSELQVYEHKNKAIEDGRLPSANGGEPEEDKYPDLADMTPELRDAYIKMRKLDRILEKKLKREKTVKRDRILLERRIRDEISVMQADPKIQRDIRTNTERYMALALPASHNQEEIMEIEGVIVDEAPSTPLFQTQVDEQDLEARRQHQHPSEQSEPSAESRRDSVTSSLTDESVSAMDADGNRLRKHGRRRKRKDFIKRNKELAGNAETIAMTDDEKKRVQELLADVDTMPEIAEDFMDMSVDNPYQVAIQPGEGFLPSDAERRTLTAIDQRLQSILPEEDFRSMASSALSHTPQQRLFTRVGVASEVDFEAYGEKALLETKEHRETNTKLKDIEDQLATFHNPDGTKVEMGALSEEQLEHLLDDCVRSMSAISLPHDTPDSSRTLESARVHLMVNPPRLTDEQLQQLLSEAHFPYSSHMMALQDDDNKRAHSGADGGVIRAETWKAIMEEPLDEEDEQLAASWTTDVSDTSAAAYAQGQGQSRLPTVPRPSVSDTSLPPSLTRGRPPLPRYPSQTSDSDGRDSRVSLPEISSTSLINTAQGGGVGGGGGSGGSGRAASNNNSEAGQLYGGRGPPPRNNSSLDSMVHNDLTRVSPLAASVSHRMVSDSIRGQSFASSNDPRGVNDSTKGPSFAASSDSRMVNDSTKGPSFASSSDSRMVNDSMRISSVASSVASSNDHWMAGTPLDVEDFGDDDLDTPVPHPPPDSERPTSRQSLKSRTELFSHRKMSTDGAQQ